MDNERTGRYWMTFAGITLVAAGLIGFVPGNAFASADPNALFRVNAIHNLIHLATGAAALWIGLRMRGQTLANAMIGYGALYAVVLILLLVDPTLFGLFADAPANVSDHVLHAALAVVSIALGWMLRSVSSRAPAR
jgi:hypothetical protein